MPFDLSTAQPVDPKAGFDLKTAQPVEDSSYDMSEYDDTLTRIAKRAKSSFKELTPEKPVTAKELRAQLAGPGAGGKITQGIAEGAMNAASSIPASVAGGLVGIAGAMLPGPEGQGARWSQGIQRAMTFEPRSETGKLASEVIAAPLTMASEGWGQIGKAAGRAIGDDNAEAAGEEFGKTVPAVVATLAGGASALNQRRGTLAAKESEAQARAEAVTRAEAKTVQAGIEWAKLPAAVRRHLADLAGDAVSFDKMTPEMIARATSLQGLPVPIKGTKGQLTRDPVQLRTEKQLSQTAAGAPIEERYIEQNKALLDNLGTLENKGSPKAKTAEEVGKQVAEKALGQKQKDAKAKVADAYKRANQSAESAETVSPFPLLDYVQDHPNAGAVSWITNHLKSQKILADTDELGSPRVQRDISLREVSELRKKAERVAQAGGEGSGWANEVKGVLDKMIEGKGGEAFAKAREAYKAYKSEFDNQKSVRQLLENSGGKYSTDRKVALEDVFKKSVVDGSIQDLRNLRETLLDAENKGTRKQGRKALNELAAQTVRYIKEESTKGVTDKTGAPEVSPAALKRAVDRIGDEKLDLLLGKTSADQLRAVVKATQDLKTSPPKRINGSDTALNALNFLDKLLDHIPVVGPFARGVGKMAKKAYEEGRSDVMVDQALLEDQYTKPYLLSDERELKAFLPGAAAASLGEVRR